MPVASGRTSYRLAWGLSVLVVALPAALMYNHIGHMKWAVRRGRGMRRCAARTSPPLVQGAARLQGRRWAKADSSGYLVQEGQ